MPLSAGEFKDIAAGVQSLAIAAGVAIGGVWTLFTFRSLRMAQKARAELLQLERAQEPGFQMSIKARALSQASSGAYTVVIELELKNPSKRTIVLDLSEPPISLAHLECNGQTEPVIAGSPIHSSAVTVEADGLEKQEIRFLRTGDVRNTIHVCSVPKPGLYLVQAKVTYGEGSLKLDGDDIANESAIQAMEQTVVHVGAVATDV